MNNQYLTSEEAVAIDCLMPGNQLFGLGSKMKAALALGVQSGTKWYLDPVNGNDSRDGLSYETAFKTLPVAYAALTANKNEVLYILGGSSALNLTIAFTWAKSYTHLVGICAGGAYGRARIGHSANFASLFTVSANGCIFQNIHLQSGRGSATNLNCLVLAQTANYNTFVNCHIDSPLHATEAAEAWRGLVLSGTPGSAIGARSNSFISCVFGDWSIPDTGGNGALVDFKGMNAGTLFKDCDFIINTTQAGFVALKAAVAIGDGNAAGYALFDGCKFLALNTGVNVVATAPTSGKLIFARSFAVGATNWSANSNNVFSATGAAIIADGGLGVVIS